MITTDPEQLRVIEQKSMCPIHHVKMMECYLLHQPAKVQVKSEEAQLSIHLPCGHIVDRPERLAVVIDCVCGKRWSVWLVENGQVWNARDISGTGQ